jgi:membrane protease YdiL (CAAX protease family)
MTPGTVVYVHALAAWFVLGTPALGIVTYRRSARRVAAGLRTKASYLRSLIPRQAASACLVCALWWVGAVPPAPLGLGAPRSWGLTAALSVAIGGLLVWASLRLRRRAPEIRKRLDARAALLIPDSPEERRWFAGVCLMGGVFEELAYRGFMFFYVRLLVPGINDIEVALLTSLLFGLGHVYQGLKGIMSTALAGLVLAVLYLVGGDLIVPIVTHVVGNIRALLIFPADGSNRSPSTGVNSPV